MQELCKPLVAILTSRVETLDEVLNKLSSNFGAADIKGKWVLFTHTNYYADEMGGGLSRCFVSFENLLRPFEAVKFKPWASKVEDEYRIEGKRSVNIDAGYIDANKLVLVTGKGGGHKISIADGIWADMLLWYNKGWVAQPWAFPDFRDGSHFETFQKMRRKFKDQVNDPKLSANV